jgi:hypothetical protein
MSTPSTSSNTSLQSRLETLIALARLLERVEASPVSVGADQYLALVRQIQGALEVELPASAMDAILGAHPATATIYENLHYETSGLSRTTLDRSVATEMLATGLIHKASRRDDASNA